jgi:ATP-dependent Clp protease protease subunit
MGFAIATCGTYRYASKRATFMYHECGWSTNYDKLTTHIQEAEEGKRLWSIYDEIITTNTNITLKALKQVQKQRKEWYITAQEALELGIIDELI